MHIAILIPLYRHEISPDEQISLNCLEHFLSSYPRIVIKPASLENTLLNCESISFPDHHFTSIAAYSKLLLSSSFYDAFSTFEYVLIYQLDCLVFSNGLEQWCKQGYDYIGSPLFLKNSRPIKFSRVGNGGLSLRRVDAFLEVLNSSHTPSWKDVLTTSLPDLNKFSPLSRWLKRLHIFQDARRGVQWYSRHYSLNEDLFWSDRARLFYPDFKIAPVDVALQFAFEAHPRYCFEQNHHQLPFGCHAWAKWDRKFWEEFLV